MTSPVRFNDHHRKADRIMLGLLWLTLLYSLSLAFLHSTFTQALLVGATTCVASTGLYRALAGTRAMRCIIAVALMVMAALHINQTRGVIEFHFGIFVLLAVLTFYRDWLPIVVAAATIAVHHLGFHWLQHQGYPVFVMDTHGGWSMVFLHAFYVVVESVILIYLANQSLADATENQDVLDKVLVAAAQLSNDAGRQHNEGVKVSSSERFDHFLQQVTQLVDGVVRDTRNLSDLGQDLSQVGQTLETGARHQLDEVAQMSGAISHLVQAMENIAGHVDQTLQRAGQANEQVNRGRSTVDQTREEIVELAGRINLTNETVQVLAEQAQQIGQVLDVINGIAEQTNCWPSTPPSKPLGPASRVVVSRWWPTKSGPCPKRPRRPPRKSSRSSPSCSKAAARPLSPCKTAAMGWRAACPPANSLRNCSTPWWKTSQ